MRRIRWNYRHNVHWGRTGWCRCGCVQVGVTRCSCLLFVSRLQKFTLWKYTFVLNKNMCKRTFLAIQICGINMCICDMDITNPVICETHSKFMYDMITGLFRAIYQLYISYVLHLFSFHNPTLRHFPRNESVLSRSWIKCMICTPSYTRRSKTPSSLSFFSVGKGVDTLRWNT